MISYYSNKLAAERLKLCYEIAPPEVKKYLQAEIEHVIDHMTPGGRVIELGCGYGRVLKDLAHLPDLLVGIDISFESLRMAKSLLSGNKNIQLLQMDAGAPALIPNQFDLVFCIQNGISAFNVEKKKLLECAVRLTVPGGKVLFSSYADQFWESRLEWFRLQADQGLIGEIDEQATGEGVIVCKDGFRATTVSSDEFLALVEGVGVSALVQTIADSSVFCEIVV
jgi:2-polyprenyl-6-hydroxyphenyl methylase/3-demethylubiquinone-9 3-methyltransferase